MAAPLPRRRDARKRTPTERANRPRGQGLPGRYEIWFLVIFEPRSQRATWLRYTTFSARAGSDEPSRAMLWAATFDDASPEPARAAKTVLEARSMAAEPEGFHLRLGDAELAEGVCRGEVRGERLQIAWDLAFAPAARPSHRLPRLLAALPLPVRSAHVHTEVAFTGTIDVDGERRALDGAIGVQMHIVGSRRAEEIRWIYAPELVDTSGRAAPVALEATAARLKRKVAGVPQPWVTGVHVGGPTGLGVTTLGPTGRVRVSRPRPLMLRVSARRSLRRVEIRCWAPPEAFVGYHYRDPRGHDLAVAQSDIADAYVEIFQRRHPLARWRPVAQRVARRTAALELHAPEPIDGVDYIAWSDRERGAGPRPDRAAERAADAAHLGGEVVALPEPGAIYALGLTYAGHLKETGEALPPVVFSKRRAAWAPSGGAVVVPDGERILAALDAHEPGLGAALRARFGFVPALMDYEVELALMVLEDVSPAALADAAAPIRLGYFLANDLTARSVQLLGEGRPDRLAYWSLAKSFPGFLPVTAALWISDDTTAARFPELTLTTRVNGAVRQSASTADILLTPREALAHVAATTGAALRRGDVVLTGTPSGVALAVPRWKRRLADRVLDRFGKLAAAIHAHARGGRFVGPGDHVEVDGGALGSRAVTLAL